MSNQSTHHRRLRKMASIEAEFDEPFWDIIQGFADMGYSKCGTARAIDYGPAAFWRLCRDEGQHINWKPYRELRCHRERYRAPDLGKRISEGVRRNSPQLRWVVFNGQKMLQRDYARMAGISETQASRLRRRGELEEVA